MGYMVLNDCHKKCEYILKFYCCWYDKDKKCCEINLPYEIENFSIPYHVQTDDLDILLKKVYEEGKPPEHMYV